MSLTYDWQTLAVTVVTHPMEERRVTLMKEDEAHRQLLDLFNRNIDRRFHYELEFNEFHEKATPFDMERTTYTLRFKALRSYK